MSKKFDFRSTVPQETPTPRRSGNTYQTLQTGVNMARADNFCTRQQQLYKIPLAARGQPTNNTSHFFQIVHFRAFSPYLYNG